MDNSLFLIVNQQFKVLSSSFNDNFFSKTDVNNLKEAFLNNQHEVIINETEYSFSYHDYNETIVFHLKKERKDLDKIINLGEMSSGMAHDINNILSTMMSSFEILKFDLEEEDIEFENQYFDHIENGITQISNLVDGVLSFCRKDQTMDRNFNYVEISNKIPTMLNTLLKNKNINLKINYKGDKSDFNYKGKDTLIFQVFLNMVKNSIDALEDLPNFSKWINIDLNSDNNHFHIKFIDGGNGIPEEISNHIFDNFYTTKSAGKGTGIGLFFCRKIIESHSGTITVDKNMKNTCFYIKIPKK